MMQRYFFASAVTAELDKQGRIVIPASLLDPAGIGGEVTVAGVYDHLEIWDRAKWREHGKRSKGAQNMLPSALPTETDHVPVLADEVLTALAPRPGETVIDCTFGAGGHASLLAARLRGEGKLIAIDRDPTSRRTSSACAAAPPRRCASCTANSRPSSGSSPANGVARRRDPARPRRLVDAARPARARVLVRGRRAARHAHGPLGRADRRATSSTRPTSASSRRSSAATARSASLGRSRARSSRRRKSEPFERTGDLVETIKRAIPAPARFGEGHPAKRVFQALRIEVNDELGSLERALPAALEILRPGGRLAVISFHSLEDRIVKRFLRAQEHGCTCPPDFPLCVCGAQPALRAVPRRAIRPSPAEVARNPRSQSARLRVGMKA